MTAPLGAVIAATEKLTGCAAERAYVDKGYRGHDTAPYSGARPKPRTKSAC
jgi:hypothetical protein